MNPATDQQIKRFIALNEAWSLKDNKLHREYVFTDFVAAFGFMTQLALHAERNNHHPEWFNVYNKLIVDLTTHEAGGISEKDFALAKQMETVYYPMNANK